MWPSSFYKGKDKLLQWVAIYVFKKSEKHAKPDIYIYSKA